MRLPEFFKLGALFVLGLGIIKIFFIEYIGAQSQYSMIAYWGISGVFAVGIIRRGGIINYLEAFAIGIVWTVFCLIFDYIILAGLFFGYTMFLHLYLWIGYFVVFAAIFLLHKKRHVHIRRGGHVESHH